MAIWWATLIGFVICLGIAGGVFVHFLRGGLDMESSTRVDKIDPDK
ncbi:hypothetical protein [Neobacillus sp. LXY-1]